MHRAGQDTKLFSREKKGTASLFFGRILPQSLPLSSSKVLLGLREQDNLRLTGIMDGEPSETKIKGVAWVGVARFFVSFLRALQIKINGQKLNGYQSPLRQLVSVSLLRKMSLRVLLGDFHRKKRWWEMGLITSPPVDVPKRIRRPSTDT